MSKQKKMTSGLAILGVTLIVALISMGAALPASAGGYHRGHEQACTRTSQAAFRACLYEIRDDYWIAVGNCTNLSDRGARWECKNEAIMAWRESGEECSDQYEGRQKVCDALGEAPYDPQIDPADFVNPDEIGDSVEPNPYFPLTAGLVWIYEGGDETITVTSTSETKDILGVKCRVVQDVVEEDGEVIEDTLDWYAQDKDGNVWYFGEIALNFEDGELVDIEGSWTAGVDGAKAGIIMKAHPAVGDVYRQEFFLGDAEDMGEVLSVKASASVPAPGASCDGDCVLTRDWTPLEPDVEEEKSYARGIGPILEVNPETNERLELVAFGFDAP